MKTMILVKGKKLFDPRTQDWKVSDNPALQFADIMSNHYKLFDEENFWQKIAAMADWCEEKDFKVNTHSII